MLYRLRRLRKNEVIRDLISENQLSVNDLIMPYFVLAGRSKKEPIKSMPGISRLSIDSLIEDIKEIRDLGIKAALLFGICRKKDEIGSQAYQKDDVVQKAIKEIKKNIKDIVIITDVCLCGYTSHGHCGIVKLANSRWLIANSKSHQPKAYSHQPEIDNDATLAVLSKIALSHAEQGVDFVAPSAMMDGQVRAIRETLDKNGFSDTGILAYSVKYASGFYGPFREALDSTPQFGDRKTYQMDFRNSDEALREISQDIQEGADIVMVKPALSYLDIIRRAKDKFNIPIAAYNVSGEYAMVSSWLMANSLWQKNKSHQPKAYSHQLRRDIVLEILTSIKRAGADLVITYHAKEVASWLMANSL